ncbi:MAG TPA: S53 family peptidase [Polyangiaceae bacterium]|nr:S53 family peptidase [Polyangiaceae bacterium]
MSLLSHHRWIPALALPLLACVPLACSGSGNDSKDDNARSENTSPSSQLSPADEMAFQAIVQHPTKDNCAEVAIGSARCLSKVRVDDQGQVQSFATPTSGFGPPDLISAYNIPSSGTSTGTIAIVDAYDDPTAEADLGVYRSNYGLSACTTANGCFKKVSQSGSTTTLPATDTGWAGEISLDLDMASAICPACKIVLVEANSASYADLGTAVNQAATQGATVISNSYGGTESSSNSNYDSLYYNHPGVAIFASSGDAGYSGGTQYPAAGANVIAVGGTSLTKSTTTSRGWVEKVWGSSTAGANGAGSGCSNYTTRPSWATAAASPNCSNKTVADVSAVADPNTGVAVYLTTGGSGWVVYGGTSAASPIVASIFALTGNGKATGSFIWSHTSSFYDSTSGTNYNGASASTGGKTCSVGTNNLCNGVTGFDAPTGWGSPNTAAILALAADAGTDGG